MVLNVLNYHNIEIELEDYNGNGIYDIKDFVEAPNEKILKYNKGMKFDCIVSNAPYDNGLHQKFESKYFELCKGEIVWVSPLSFLLGKKQNKRITLELDKYKSDMADEHNEHNEHYVKFDGKQYSKCEEIRSYSNDELLVNFYNIVSPLYKNTNLEQHLKTMSTSRYTKYNTKNQNINNYILRFDRCAGNKERGDDFYTFLHKGNISKCIGTYKDLSKQTYIYGNKLYNFVEFYFDLITKHNCENFRNYLMCDFARTCLYLIKNTTDLMRGELKYIPWFDFSDPVFSKSPTEIDDYLFKKYHISDKIRKHIEELLPDYYNIRKGRD